MPDDLLKEETKPTEELIPDSTGDEDVEEEELAEPTEEEASAEEPAEVKPEPAISTELQDLKTELAYLRGLVAAKAEPVTPKPADEDEVEPDDDTFLEQLRTDPVNAIKARDERLLKKITKQLQNREATTAQLQAAAGKDVETLLRFYPDIQQQPEFLTMATNIYNALRQQYGEAPGLRTLAAHTAYGSMVREGKIPVTNTKPTEKKPKPPIALEAKRADRTSGKDPLSGFSEEEKASIGRTCQKLGITLEDYRKNYDAARKGDKRFGE